MRCNNGDMTRDTVLGTLAGFCMPMIRIARLTDSADAVTDRYDHVVADSTADIFSGLQDRETTSSSQSS